MHCKEKSENKNVLSDIKWSRDGYIFRAKIDCVIDPATLKNAILDLDVTNDGTFSPS